MQEIKFRSQLSVPGLYKSLCYYFIQHARDPKVDNENIKIKSPSVLMSALWMFALKYPSLLQFDKKRNQPTISHNSSWRLKSYPR